MIKQGILALLLLCGVTNATTQLLPGPFIIGSGGFAYQGFDQPSSEIVYSANDLTNRDFPGSGDHKPTQQLTVVCDVTKIGQQTQIGNTYYQPYLAELWLYENPTFTANINIPSSFRDGNLLLYFLGSGIADSTTSFAVVNNSRCGNLFIAWPDQFPFTNIGTEFQMYPTPIDGYQFVDCSIDLKYRVAGDCNLDGWITASDLAQMDASYLKSLTDTIPVVYTWSQGDFNGDGLVNSTDYSLMAITWQEQYPQYQQVGLFEIIPEPSTLLLLGFAGLTLTFKRKEFYHGN